MNEFKRENRYIVIKLNQMPRDTLNYLECSFRQRGIPQLEGAVVVESDWPEYEPTWQMIERRMTGQPAVSAAEELDAVLHWRGKHVVAIKERDALQALLTAADERADRLESGIKWEAERNALLLASLTEAEDMLSVTSLEAGRRIEQLEELLRDINDAPGGSQFKKHIDAALKPAEGGGDELV